MARYPQQHLEIPQIPMAVLAMDTIGCLPIISKSNRWALTAICPHISHMFAVPMKEKSAENVVQTYLSGILAHKCGSMATISDNGTVFKNKVLNEVCDHPCIKRLFSNLFHPQGNAKVENVHTFPNITLTEFLDNSDLKWDELLPFTYYCYNLFPSSNGTESPFFLMFGWDPVEGHLSHIHNSNRYYGTNEWKKTSGRTLQIMEVPCQTSQRNGYMDQQTNKNPTFKTGQPVMVKNHAHCTFIPKYWLDYRVLRILKNSTLLLVIPNAKERKTNINDAKPCSTSELIENVWDSFLGSIKINHQNSTHNLRPWP